MVNTQLHTSKSLLEILRSYIIDVTIMAVISSDSGNQECMNIK